MSQAKTTASGECLVFSCTLDWSLCFTSVIPDLPLRTHQGFRAAPGQSAWDIQESQAAAGSLGCSPKIPSPACQPSVLDSTETVLRTRYLLTAVFPSFICVHSGVCVCMCTFDCKWAHACRCVCLSTLCGCLLRPEG